jgi:hypothetical protein
MTAFEVHISEDFGPVLTEIDKLVIEQGSSISAIVRAILFDFFGIVPENQIGERCRIDAAMRRMQKMEQR